MLIARAKGRVHNVRRKCCPAQCYHNFLLSSFLPVPFWLLRGSERRRAWVDSTLERNEYNLIFHRLGKKINGAFDKCDLTSVHVLPPCLCVTWIALRKSMLIFPLPFEWYSPTDLASEVLKHKAGFVFAPGCCRKELAASCSMWPHVSKHTSIGASLVELSTATTGETGSCFLANKWIAFDILGDWISCGADLLNAAFHFWGRPRH